MGYYTRYNISENPQTVQEAIEQKSQYSFYSGQTDTVKWYDWQEHCKEVSKDFPNLVIKIEGDGVFNFPRDNRKSARDTMKEWKESGFDAKIIQRKYSLVTEKAVR